MKRLASYKFIFVSPEMLQSELLIRELKKVHISLFVVMKLIVFRNGVMILDQIIKTKCSY